MAQPTPVQFSPVALTAALSSSKFKQTNQYRKKKKEDCPDENYQAPHEYLRISTRKREKEQNSEIHFLLQGIERLKNACC